MPNVESVPDPDDDEIPSFIESVRQLHATSKVIWKHLFNGTEPTTGDGGEIEQFLFAIILLNGRPELEGPA